MLPEGGLGEVFGGLAGSIGGAEVGVRVVLTLVVLVGALVVRRVVVRAVRRRFGTTGERGGEGSRRRGGTSATALTGSAN